jgi:hypothetical protein
MLDWCGPISFLGNEVGAPLPVRAYFIAEFWLVGLDVLTRRSNTQIVKYVGEGCRVVADRIIFVHPEQFADKGDDLVSYLYDSAEHRINGRRQSDEGFLGVVFEALGLAEVLENRPGVPEAFRSPRSAA